MRWNKQHACASIGGMTTVAQLAARLGANLLVSSRGELDAALSAVVVTDPVSSTTIPPGALIIAVGHPLEHAAQLQAQALAAGAGGVVIKGSNEPAVTDSGPAVLVIDPVADWGHVISLARVAVSTMATLDAPTDDSLFSLADALASLCGGSVVIHDSGWHLLAHSGGEVLDVVRSETLLGRRAPAETLERLREQGYLDRLIHGELIHVLDGEVEGLSERYAAAVLVEGQLFGTIWVTPAPDTDAEESLEGLRKALDVAALALLRQATIGTVASPDHDAPFASLLNGAHTERLVAQRLGVSLNHGFVLAGIRPVGHEPTERAATSRRLLRLARSYCEAYRVTALSAAAGETTFLLFPCPNPDERAGALRVLSDMHARLQRSAPHRAAMSTHFGAVADVIDQRDLVEELLDLAERRGWAGLTDTDVVHATWRLEQFREVALAHPSLLEGPAMRLAEHDRKHGGDLLPTLRAYFTAVGDAKAAAKHLGVHYNTVRYRLGKAAEVSGLDLNDPDQRLLAELQVRLLTD